MQNNNVLTYCEKKCCQVNTAYSKVAWTAALVHKGTISSRVSDNLLFDFNS